MPAHTIGNQSPRQTITEAVQAPAKKMANHKKKKVTKGVEKIKVKQLKKEKL